jgi:hypothetical protein
MTPLRTLRPSRFSWIVPSVAALIVAQACADRAGDCDANSNCTGGSSIGGSNAGNAGNVPEAGAESGGSSSGKSGASGASGKGGNANGGSSGGGGAGEGGSDAGAGGTAVTPPCGGDCPTDKPVCKEATDTCVECLSPNDCTTGAEKKCDTASNNCVECLASADCSEPTAAKCDKGACVKCANNDDCAHLIGKTVCDTAAGECVQCTGKDYAACGSSMGTPLVCDSKLRSCSTKKERSSGLCQECVSDAQCSAGKLCVVETFGAASAEVGSFCFWKKGDTANGAPANCLPAADPYAKTLSQQTSVDGAVADVCGLRASTCTARNDLNASKDCATSALPDDSKCGFDAPNDAKCVLADLATYRCTTTCISNDDCDSGVVCDTGVSPKVCKLQ